MATKKSGASKSRSKRASKRAAQQTPDELSKTGIGAGTIPQSDADAAFNRATSAGATPAAQTSAVTAAGRAGARAGAQKFDETVPGGRYKGTDGRYRSADGALHPDQSSE